MAIFLSCNSSLQIASKTLILLVRTGFQPFRSMSVYRPRKKCNSSTKTSTRSKCPPTTQPSEKFPVRIPVIVICLARLKAKPVANHANAHPRSSLVVIGFYNLHCAVSPPQHRFQNRHHQDKPRANEHRRLTINRAANFAFGTIAKRLA